MVFALLAAQKNNNFSIILKNALAITCVGNRIGLVRRIAVHPSQLPEVWLHLGQLLQDLLRQIVEIGVAVRAVAAQGEGEHPGFFLKKIYR